VAKTCPIAQSLLLIGLHVRIKQKRWFASCSCRKPFLVRLLGFLARICANWAFYSSSVSKSSTSLSMYRVTIHQQSTTLCSLDVAQSRPLKFSKWYAHVSWPAHVRILYPTYLFSEIDHFVARHYDSMTLAYKAWFLGFSYWWVLITSDIGSMITGTLRCRLCYLRIGRVTVDRA